MASSPRILIGRQATPDAEAMQNAPVSAHHRSARSANLIAGDGLSRSEQRTDNNQKRRLDRKSPIQVCKPSVPQRGNRRDEPRPDRRLSRRACTLLKRAIRTNSFRPGGVPEWLTLADRAVIGRSDDEQLNASIAGERATRFSLRTWPTSSVRADQSSWRWGIIRNGTDLVVVLDRRSVGILWGPVA